MVDCRTGSGWTPADTEASIKAVGNIEKASESAINPSSQALQAFNDEITEFYSRHGGSACINDLKKFQKQVIGGLGEELPKAMSLAWAKEGDAIGGSDGYMQIGGANSDLKETDLDAFIKRSKGSGFLGHEMASILKSQFPSLKSTTGGFNVLGMNLFGDDVMSKQTLNAQLSAADANLARRAAKR